MMRGDRRQRILEAFALMLEESPGSRITTAALARQVGVSEAALYRHFPSKAKMIEGLIEFMESSVFSRITRILEEEASAEGRCRNLLRLLLTFEGKIAHFQHNHILDQVLTSNSRSLPFRRYQVKSLSQYGINFCTPLCCATTTA